MVLDPDRFLASLRDGLPLRNVFRVKGRPPKGTVRLNAPEKFREYCKQFPEWGREACALVERNAEAARKRRGHALVRCKRGHLLAGGNIAFKKNIVDGKLYRYCKACGRLRATWGTEMTPQQEQKVIRAVQLGFNITQITRGRSGQAAICSFATLKRRRIANPILDRFIIEKARQPLSRSQLIRCKIVPSNAAFFSLTISRPEIPPFEMRPGDYEWILSLINRGLPHDMRLDVAQDVIEALLCRAISREEVPSRIVDFISRHRRSFGNPEYAYSLDDPLTEDGRVTRVDLVSRQMWENLGNFPR